MLHLKHIHDREYKEIFSRLSIDNRGTFVIFTPAELVLTGSIPGFTHIFGILICIYIPACLIKQPNGSLIRMCV